MFNYSNLLLIVFEFAFIANTTISTMLNFFIGKSGLINFVKFILKYRNKNNTKKELKDIPLTELDEKGVALKNNENVEKESLLSEGQKTLITLFAYIIVIFVGYASESIITVDNFNGSTVNNYLSVMLPALFFIILTRNKGFSFERLLAFFLFLFSLSLITSFLLINFTNILG